MVVMARESVKTGMTRKRRYEMLSDVMERLKPADVVAITMMLVCGALIALGNDSSITAIMLAISAYYFGHNRE
jgi:hypothetical protein